MLAKLAELSRISTRPNPNADDICEACQVVQEGLSAEEAYIIRAGDPHFIRLGCDDDPTTYEIKQKGYWLVWQRLAINMDIPSGTFDVKDRLVLGGSIVVPGKQCTHLASILPGDESNAEVLIARGPWPDGLTLEQVEFAAAARPMLARVVSNMLDSERQLRQREQLSALADVSKAFNEAREMDRVLTSVATALAKASGFDWVTIYIYNDELDTIVDQAMNLARHYGTDTAAMARDGRVGGILDKGARARFVRQMARTGRPVLMPDVFSPEVDSMPGMREYRDGMRAMRTFWERAHILSEARFLIVVQQKPLGQVVFSSSTKRDFRPPEVDFLSALVSQAATTIQGLRLYRDLARSQEELRDYAEKLEETSRVEHFLARTDPLTGLPNRRCIEEAMEAECARVRRYDQTASVAMADIDYFKRINDGYGHQTGDDALRFVAAIARQACRAADLVARWGGDEFVFILPSTGVENARNFANRFRRVLARSDFTHQRLEKSVRMTISLGVAEASIDTSPDAGLLLQQADKALYEAKESGRNRVVVAPAGAVRAA